MRLRYLHLDNYPPIHDLTVRFASGSPLQRECAIRFVVGVNGSGKSNLLRALTEVFLALSEQRVPLFPVSLVYELGVRGSSSHRTLVLDCSGSRSSAGLWMAEHFYWEDNADAETFGSVLADLRDKPQTPPKGFTALIAPGEWPSGAGTPPAIALPNAVLAYTTGAMQPWQSLWSRHQFADDLDLGSDVEEYDVSLERPSGWTMALEMANPRDETASVFTPDEDSVDNGTAASAQNLFRRPILLTPALLKCALLAVALPQAFLRSEEIALEHALSKYCLLHLKQGSGYNPSPLQELLARGGWHHLVSVAFRCRLQANIWPRQLCETAHDWLLCAGEVIAEPHPTETQRTLFFDVEGRFNNAEVQQDINGLAICRTQGEALWALLGGGQATAFDLFTKLAELHQSGLFDDVELRLRREPKPDEQADFDALKNDIGVLRFEELSDGEQMVLGRMALFHLLAGQQDALLLLDEPETHFNDKWKREIVDIIDTAIGKTANDVLIATHSAIVLSDVFNDEIIMVQKSDQGSEVRSVLEQTFATDPSALMMTVFGANDSIGKRAQEFIETLLAQATGTADEIRGLEQLIARMGTGFYRSELRTLLNQWKSQDHA